MIEKKLVERVMISERSVSGPLLPRIVFNFFADHHRLLPQAATTAPVGDSKDTKDAAAPAAPAEAPKDKKRKKSKAAPATATPTAPAVADQKEEDLYEKEADRIRKIGVDLPLSVFESSAQRFTRLVQEAGRKVVIDTAVPIGRSLVDEVYWRFLDLIEETSKPPVDEKAQSSSAPAAAPSSTQAQPSTVSHPMSLGQSESQVESVDDDDEEEQDEEDDEEDE